MNRKLKYLVLGVLVVAASGACTDDFEKINDNPNLPALWEIAPINMIEEVVFYGADHFLERTRSFNGEVIQYTVTGSSSTSVHRYNIPNTTGNGIWNSLFELAANSSHMSQLVYMPERANGNLQAIALTMKALYMSNLTDIFGEVPCSEAFKGQPYYDDSGDSAVFVTSVVLNPQCDAQRDIYRQIYTWLEKASGLYNQSEQFPQGGARKDLLYGGDISKWEKFTNSLYLRLLMRLSNRSTEKIVHSANGTEISVAEKIREIFENTARYPVFESNDDNATLFFSGEYPNENRFGKNEESAFRRDMSEQLNQMMNEFHVVDEAGLERLERVSDPRLSTYFVSGSSWKGGISGKSDDEDEVNGNDANKAVLGDYTSPYSFMKYDEVLFILCEAAKRGFIPGGDVKALELYNKAIRTSILYWQGIDPAKEVGEREISNFLSGAHVVYDYTLGCILNQKYVAMFWVGYEAWHDYRRTGYPNLAIGSGTFNDHVLPTRLVYPFRFSTTNPDSYNAAVERIKATYHGDDDMRTPVWWSKQAVEME
ncbi:MAG: SusD/RagB family nutrient-binding outer membrane lipoprotein [Prevotellaceae bacterium]|jgi:hypothetical protein|nr:SusD/RagB family nutrient-binding outer membrane lipoprotein [Prevotellaceae bacterium]